MLIKTKNKIKHFQLLLEKNKLLFPKKTVNGSFRYGITMSKCRTKAIQTDLPTFRHNQTYPGIIQAYSDVCVTLTYLKLWYIQNPNIFRTRSIFTILVYPGPRYIQNTGIFKYLLCQISTMKHFAKIVNGLNYLHKL